jgi:putative endonuclease
MSGIGANHTKVRLPVTLVYVEVFDYVYLAYKRERQIHNWGHNKKKALIEGSYELLHSLAECKNDSHWKNLNNR